MTIQPILAVTHLLAGNFVVATTFLLVLVLSDDRGLKNASEQAYH